MQKQESAVEIFKVVGVEVEKHVDEKFGSNGVFIIVDPGLKKIWIWTGTKSRLFHRYIAATWAGKGKKKYLGFDSEIIKEGQEPEAFQKIFENSKGQSSGKTVINKTSSKRDIQMGKKKIYSSQRSPNEPNSSLTISKLELVTLSTNLNDLKEIHDYFIYLLKQAEETIHQTEDILKKYDLIV